MEKLLSVAPMNGRQREELENLKKFLVNPWDETIKRLNFKIILEISKIIASSGLEELKNRTEKQIPLLEADLSKKESLLEIKKLEKVALDTAADTTGIFVLKTYISGLNEEINKTNSQITDNKKVLETISELDPESFDEFKNTLEKGTESISLLGKDNDEEIKQTVSNSNFSLSQAAIIDAVGNAIIEQVKEGLVNSLFETILDKDIDLVNNSSELISNYPAGTVCTKSSQTDKGRMYELKVPDNVNSTYRTVNIFIDKNTKSVKLKDELKIFFPKTIDVLERLKESKTDNYFTNLNITLKNSFTDDLKNMLDNVTNESNIRNSKIFKNFFYDSEGKKNQTYNYLILAVEIFNNIKNGFHPVELIPILNDNLKGTDYFEEYSMYINLIDVLQKNLRDINNSGKEIWINITNLADLNTLTYPGSSSSSAEFFMAIIYQSTKNEYIKDQFAPSSVKAFNDSEFVKFKTGLSSFIILLRSVEKNIDELTKGSGKSFNDYSQYLNNFMTLLDTTNGLIGNFFFDPAVSSKIKNQIDTFKVYSGYSMEIYESITNGSYSKILPVALKIFDNEFRLAENNIKFKNEFVRYTNLYVDISTATSQSELNSAISKAAHNSGGYLRKSEEPFNISVDSYPGIFISSEKLNGSVYGKPNFGFSVPVGFNIQYERFSFFLQAVDIAAAVNYRFNNDSTTNLPSDVTFQQVFSPGLFLVYNPFPKYPLSLSLGLSVTPALREVNGSGITLNDSKSTFFGVYISYNIPLWYLY